MVDPTDWAHSMCCDSSTDNHFILEQQWSHAKEEEV